MRDAVDGNIEQIVQKNSIFNIYLTIVEIFYFCIIAQEDILKYSQMPPRNIHSFRRKVDVCRWHLAIGTLFEM